MFVGSLCDVARRTMNEKKKERGVMTADKFIMQMILRVSDTFVTFYIVICQERGFFLHSC